MMPDVCIASDFIVGFSTETDEDFAQSVQMVQRCRFKNSFISNIRRGPARRRWIALRMMCPKM